MKLRNAVASLVLFTALIVLYTEAYGSLSDAYSFTNQDLQTYNGTSNGILDHMRQINVVEGINDLEQGVLKLQPPSGSSTDILGGLASVGIGAVKLILGLITIPYEIARIIITFYAGEVPGVIGGIMTQLVVIYVGFILLSLYLRKDI